MVINGRPFRETILHNVVEMIGATARRDGQTFTLTAALPKPEGLTFWDHHFTTDSNDLGYGDRHLRQLRPTTIFCAAHYQYYAVSVGVSRLFTAELSQAHDWPRMSV